jgi:nitroreductase
MELEDLVRSRRMCRDFSGEPVEPHVVDRLIDLGRRAPSAGHTQGWTFMVLEGAELTARFWAADASPEWIADPTLPGLLRAPVVIVPWTSQAAYERRYGQADKVSSALPWSVPYWIVDTSFATMLVLLGVEAEGLGALFFRLRPGAEQRLRNEFAVPPEWSAIGALAIGHRRLPKEASRPARPLRALDEVVMRGPWRTGEP